LRTSSFDSSSNRNPRRCEGRPRRGCSRCTPRSFTATPWRLSSTWYRNIPSRSTSRRPAGRPPCTWPHVARCLRCHLYGSLADRKPAGLLSRRVVEPPADGYCRLFGGMTAPGARRAGRVHRFPAAARRRRDDRRPDGGPSGAPDRALAPLRQRSRREWVPPSSPRRFAGSRCWDRILARGGAAPRRTPAPLRAPARRT
jgi:hypothetical protein